MYVVHPDSSPILSGTKFYNARTQGDVNGNGNNDSVTRSVTSKNDKAAQSNAVKK